MPNAAFLETSVATIAARNAEAAVKRESRVPASAADRPHTMVPIVVPPWARTIRSSAATNVLRMGASRLLENAR
jgi:hypothetical protein